MWNLLSILPVAPREYFIRNCKMNGALVNFYRIIKKHILNKFCKCRLNETGFAVEVYPLLFIFICIIHIASFSLSLFFPL